MQKNYIHTYETVKLGTEYSLIPLHFLALAHYSSLAVGLGALIFVIYSTVTIKHLKAVKVSS